MTISQLMHFLIQRRTAISENDIQSAIECSTGSGETGSILMFGFVLECRVE